MLDDPAKVSAYRETLRCLKCVPPVRVLDPWKIAENEVVWCEACQHRFKPDTAGACRNILPNDLKAGYCDEVTSHVSRRHFDMDGLLFDTEALLSRGAPARRCGGRWHEGASGFFTPTVNWLDFSGPQSMHREPPTWSSSEPWAARPQPGRAAGLVAVTAPARRRSIAGGQLMTKARKAADPIARQDGAAKGATNSKPRRVKGAVKLSDIAGKVGMLEMACREFTANL